MPSPSRLDPHYQQAVSLADAARGWFDGPGRTWLAQQSPTVQVQALTESVATTARLMAAISWMLHPAHDVAPGPAFHPPDDPPMPPHHPLTGTLGGDIATASRHLIQRLKDLP